MALMKCNEHFRFCNIPLDFLPFRGFVLQISQPPVVAERGQTVPVLLSLSGGGVSYFSLYIVLLKKGGDSRRPPAIVYKPKLLTFVTISNLDKRQSQNVWV